MSHATDSYDDDDDDMLSNIDEFNFVLSSIHALQQLYLPDHVIYGGDWNADFSRPHS